MDVQNLRIMTVSIENFVFLHSENDRRGGLMVSALVCAMSSLSALLCSWERQFALTVFLSTQV